VKISVDQSRLAGLEYVRGSVTAHEGKFLHELVDLSEASVVVEVGSWVGVSTIYIAQALKERGRGTLYAIDPHVGTILHYNRKIPDTEPLLRENLRRFDVAEHVEVVRATSLEALEQWPSLLGLAIDFLFIDGSHYFRDVRADFFGWSPWVRSGGIVAFHDYPMLSGPRRTVDEIVRPSGVWVELGKVQRLIAFGRKR